MRSLQWRTSHAVFVTEIDDEHQEIFESLTTLQKSFTTTSGNSAAIQEATRQLVARIASHFAHEERIMHAARYDSLPWHQQLHKAARKRVAKFVRRIDQEDPKAVPEMVTFLTGWLHNHTRLADRMMGAFLRNHERCMWKVTFHAGTRPMDACDWVDSDGNAFDPAGRNDS